MPNVHFAIQAHPARADRAQTLVEDIGGAVSVVFDPEPTSEIKSPWRTYRRVLEETPESATHCMITQDDAIVCQHFRTAVERAVEARPDRVLVFFVGTNANSHAYAVRHACRIDEPWAELSYQHWCPVVATCWPVSLIQPFLDFVDRQRWPLALNGDDEIAGRFLRDIKHYPLASVPSLAEHLDEAPSLKSRRKNTRRHAVCFIGKDCGECVLEIDWMQGPG